jgi:hydroxymethylpyrimidine pyrophosphatase-like HAD family hydrolase
MKMTTSCRSEWIGLNALLVGRKKLGKPYAEEINYFNESFLWAVEQNVRLLELFFNQWADRPAYIVGSGGSYSAACAIAEMRDLAFGSFSKSVTPLEFIAKAKLPSLPKAILISSEGKNPDILAAAEYAAGIDVNTAAFTLTANNPLLDFAKETRALRTFDFQMTWGKDGYLATNTLISTVAIFYQAFFGKISLDSFLYTYFSRANLESTRKIFCSDPVLNNAASKNILLLHGAYTKLLAIDLESKLSEAAITNVEIADYRQFAHGRHLQLHNLRKNLCVIAVYSEEDEQLSADTARLIPSEIPIFTWKVPGESPQDIVVTSIVTACLMTEAIALGANVDPGQPYVPDYGREIHHINVGKYFLTNKNNQEFDKYYFASLRKLDGVVPSAAGLQEIINAAKIYEQTLGAATFKAIISDFDGTLCNPENRYIGMCPDIAKSMAKLMDEGMQLAIASGRGNSLHECLRKAFDEKYHSNIWVGYYGGSTIQKLSDPFVTPDANNDFKELLAWLKTTVFAHLCPNFEDAVRGGQLTIKLSNSKQSSKLRLAIRTWAVQTNRAKWRVYNSGHSLDVLDENTSKTNVATFIASHLNINPDEEILRLGDNGDEDGNDHELLGSGLSLSSDKVSSSVERCWNFATSGCSHAAATHSYLNALTKTANGHTFVFLNSLNRDFIQ